MPELPEVETVVRDLAPRIEGQTVVRARLTSADLYRRGSRSLAVLRGARVCRVARMGKAIVITLTDGREGCDALVIHLGMTGRLLSSGAGAGVAAGARSPGDAGAFARAVGEREDAGPGPGRSLRKHRHARFVFADATELWYVDPRRFGYFFVGRSDDLREELRIGPDPFELTPRRLREQLLRRRAPIKSILLNQRVVSGIGNIYADEILHLAGLHPGVPAADAAGQSERLLRSARRVLRRAIRHRGTTLRDYRTPDGGRGAYQKRLMVYGREGEPCGRCGGAIRRVMLLGRGTHFCPTCQKARRPSAR